MPWKSGTIMDHRQEFVHLAAAGEPRGPTPWPSVILPCLLRGKIWLACRLSGAPGPGRHRARPLG